jgi:hypothetical protein
VLTAALPTTLNWTWPYADPDSWNIQQSPDGVGGWADFDTASGSARTDPGMETGFWYRVFGQDIDDNQITGYSNVVYLP